MARVQVFNETTLEPADEDEWTLWFQWCRYIYDNGKMESGYRFIWKRPESEGGSLQAARGQARIPSIAVIQRLVEKAKKEGWGDYDADEKSTYTLEIIAPFVVGSPNNNAGELARELVALAEKHEGIVFESHDTPSTTTSFRRRCANMVDNESSLEEEVEELRKKYPDTRFVLKVEHWSEA
ncbi:MAG: hypothetical protein ABSG63_20825 [Spirochaetia bacterium]|jgi:hypothetical protein